MRMMFDTHNIFQKYLVVCILVLAISCHNPNTPLEKERDKWQFTNWKQQFKDYTLCQCILKGYNNKDISNSIENIDRSFASPINYAVFDSTTQIIIKLVVAKIKRDSLKSVGRIAESAAGKHVFEECLSFYKSTQLDLIVNLESKKWGEIKSIDSLIDRKVPSF